MAAAMNGMALHGGVIPYGGTFLVFTDYARPAIRLSALQQARVIYVMTHDSIGLGEDGPTHQPIEHLQSLRAMPQLEVYRPADAVETAECWALALAERGAERPRADPAEPAAGAHRSRRENLCARGAYRLKAADKRAQGHPHRHRLGSRNRARLPPQQLEGQGIGADVVSMPCTERFDAQPADYREDILPDVSNREILRVSIEAGTTFGWERYTGLHGLRIGIDRFGVSAPAPDAYDYFGLTADKIVAAHHRLHENKRNSMTKVAINGFGRIGRLVARAILERPDCGLELVSVNDLADAKANAWLFKHDSVHGKFPGEVDDRRQRHHRRRQAHPRHCREATRPSCRTRDNGVDIALECTGFFTDRDGRREAYRGRRQEGADLGPGQGRRPDGRLRRQRRQADRRAQDRLQRLLHDQLPRAGRQGAERRDRHRARPDDHDPRLHQRPEDPRPDPHGPAPRPRRRDVKMIPTTTGAARAVGEVLPELKGKLDGSAIRVPVPDGSLST